MSDKTVTTQPDKALNCQYCDGTGDVHSIDGEWRGECTECDAAILNDPGYPFLPCPICHGIEGCSDTVLERRAAAALAEVG